MCVDAVSFPRALVGRCGDGDSVFGGNSVDVAAAEQVKLREGNMRKGLPEDFR